MEFEHITVPSRNLQKAILFYTALGMKLVEVEDGHHAHFENKAHHVIFTAYYNEKRPDYEVKVYFEVHKIEVYEARFRESIYSKTALKEWQGKELELLDPDGNHVVLYEKLMEGSVPPWQRIAYES